MFPSAYYQPYVICSPRYWYIRDRPWFLAGLDPVREDTRFHIKENDYFSTLATVLRFFEESIHAKNVTPAMRKLQLKTIRKVIEELLYLDKNYIITPKKRVLAANAKYF